MVAQGKGKRLRHALIAALHWLATARLAVAKIAARADSASPGLRALPVAAAPAPPTKRPADDRLPVATERPKPKKAKPYGDFSGW